VQSTGGERRFQGTDGVLGREAGVDEDRVLALNEISVHRADRERIRKLEPVNAVSG
jgi:hypothetical protein